MPCCRHSPAAAASAAATRSLLLLVLLQLFAAWPAPPQQQHPQRGNSRTPHSHVSHDDAWRRPRFFYASAKGCCSKGNSTTGETAAAAAESRAPAPTTTSNTNSSSNALVGGTQGDATARSLHMNMKSVSSPQSAQDTSDGKDKNEGSGEGSGMPPCCGVMPMYFVTTTHTIILFSWWETLKVWQYWISVVVCLFLGIFSILLKVVRMHVERWLVLREAAAAAGARGGSRRLGGGGGQMTGETCCSSKDGGRTSQGEQQEGVKGASKGVLAATVGVVCCRSIAGFPLRSNCCRMVQAFILYGYDYLLMLIVMSYNVGLFFAVTGGLALGFFFFGHLLVYRHRTNSSPQQQKQNVEMHDFHAGDPLCCGA